MPLGGTHLQSTIVVIWVIIWIGVNGRMRRRPGARSMIGQGDIKALRLRRLIWSPAYIWWCSVQLKGIALNINKPLNFERIWHSSTVLFLMIITQATLHWPLRWCYTRRFATMIFSVTQHCNIVSTWFEMVTTLFQHGLEWLQHCFNSATLRSPKNRRSESSRVTWALQMAVTKIILPPWFF